MCVGGRVISNMINTGLKKNNLFFIIFSIFHLYIKKSFSHLFCTPKIYIINMCKYNFIHQLEKKKVVP
ncbi:hypothetical protein BDA99DRAFT_516848 [Phascolomyces articulosus]|uniref:Uncharacterized protein n=1 Tax=Phascolomyces articulosus TaxID=60185 RepID=A0AAD5K681_9FUNG|nr:hypothetical protein BDA99DRAFT_516848 [Phascolomyces articulosus]